VTVSDPAPSASRPPAIELVFDADCPNVDRARNALRQALAVAGLPEGWSERVQESGPEESCVRHPSPTILIDGRDPFGMEAGRAAGCRLYENGSPAVAGLAAALEAARRRRARAGCG
jgi:hypothetical protein